MENGSIKLNERLDKIESDLEICKAHTERVIIHLDFQKEILEELKTAVKEIVGMRADIQVLKSKSSWVGLLGGILAFVAAALFEYYHH